MKIATIVSTLALSAALTQATQSQADYPGICTSTKDCTTYGSNYACTSVDSSVAGLENLSMCIPGGTVCSGSISGSCPTFSAWPKAYRAVQPVCVLVPVANCNMKITVSNDTATNGTVTTTGNGTVECYSKNFTSGSTTVAVDGIYQCVDYAKVLSLNYFYIPDLATNASKACAYSSSDKTLCSSQGTCAPTASFGQNYECKCNKGYDGMANCSTITSNQCSSLGQCGTLGTCTVASGATTGTCSCEAGSKGDQCTQCDASSSSACSGHGTCGSDGKCTCSTGYSGTFCTDGSTTTTTTPTPATTSAPTSGAAKSSNWPSIVATAVASVMTVAGVGAMAFA
ncbi:hypothetical protein Gpo141_00009646 [Globisporangium polare]